MNQSYSLLVNSSDGFEDCWRPFFTLFGKYWPSFDAPILLNTEKKQWSFPGMNIQCTRVQGHSKPRLTWSECLIRALDQVQTPLVLYFQEDYFLHQPVRADVVRQAADYMMKHPEVKHIALTRHGSHGPYEPHPENWLEGIRQRARYRISTQAALWRVDVLKSYLHPKENGWMFEIFGSWRAHRQKDIFLVAKFDETHGGPAIDYLHTGIIKGKWLKAIQPVFEKNNIEVDYSKRGFYVPKHPLFHKFDLARKLLEQPALLFDQISFLPLLRSSVIVSVLTISGSILGFVVQLLLARRFGMKVEMDAYFFSLSTPTFLAGMMSAMLSYIVVPRLVSLERDPTFQRLYMGSVVLSITLLSLIFGTFGNHFGTLQKHFLPVDSKILKYESLSMLMILAWLIGASQMLSGCLTAALNALRKYKSGAILGLFPYFGMILLLLVAGSSASITIAPLGMLLGTLAAVLTSSFLLSQQLFPLPWKQMLWPEIKKLASNAPFTIVAMSCFSAYSVVDAYWAPHAGEGALSSLGYGQRLIIGLGSLVIAGPAVVLVPHFAEFIRDRDHGGFRRFLIRALLIVGVLSAGLALFLSLFVEKLIHLLFERGAFGHQEVVLLAGVLRRMAPGMVAMLMSVISLRALFCIEGTEKAAAALGLMWTTTYFVTSSLFYGRGATGLATGYSISWIIYLLVLGILIFKYTPKATKT